MNKKELISRVNDTLRNNNIRKPISSPKHVFHLSDDEGNHKDFVVKQTDKSVIYNIKDITAILDACLSVVEDAVKRGEDISIHGFGTLSVQRRAARRTKHPDTGKPVEIDAHYIPKFSFGNTLRRAAKLFELSLDDCSHIPEPLPYEESDE